MSLPVLALAGAVPILIAFVLLVGIRWSAARAMGVGWAAATVLGLAIWRMETMWWAAAAVYGMLQALEIIIIVFGAILLMNHLERSGAVPTIRWHFTRISKDRRIQLLLVGMGFVTLIEGAAGFGTPGALAAPLLIGLGFPPMAAAIFGLYFNAPQPPFGAAGTPVIGGVGAVIDAATLADGPTVSQFLDHVTGWTAVVTGSALLFWGLFGVFLMLHWFGEPERRSLRGALRQTLPVAPFALLLGLLAGATQLAVAWLFGPELPDIMAGFVVLGVGIVLSRRGVLMPTDDWTFPGAEGWPESWHGGLEVDAEPETEDETDQHMPALLAWTPYLLVALVLIVTRWPGLDLTERLQEFSIDVDRILGQDLSFSLEYLYLPGVLPFIPVAILTGFLHRMDPRSMAGAWRQTATQVGGPALTLVIAVSMTQIMIQSETNQVDVPGMMEALSRVLALGAGGAMPLVSPWIGTLGSFMTGSNTSSNILFSALQHDAAGVVGLPRTIMVALQNVGGGIGNMLSVLNVAAICGVIGLTGQEGRILRKTAIPTAVYAILAGLVGLLLTTLLPGLY